MTIAPQGSAKKPYQAPDLTVYGGLQKLTHATGAKAKQADGGKGLNNKTG